MKKLSAKLQNELIEAGHLISVRGRFFISLDALRHVSGEPIVPEPDEQVAPPPSKRDLLVAERAEQHERQAAELAEEATHVLQAEQAAPATDSGATGGSADGDRSQDRDRSKG